MSKIQIACFIEKTMSNGEEHTRKESALVKDIAEVQSLIGSRLMGMANQPWPICDKSELYFLGDIVALIADKTPEFLRENRGNLYAALIKAKYSDERIRKISLFRDYTPPAPVAG